MALSLYAPHLAKILAYADCSIQMMSGDPHFCDCNKIVETDAIPVAPDQPNKEKDISLKADWKYIGQQVYHFSSYTSVNQNAASVYRSPFIPATFPAAVFHPPQA